MSPPRSHHFSVLLIFAILFWLALRARAEDMTVTLRLDADYQRHLIQAEGYRLTAYPDRQGTWSVGIGHSLGHGRPSRMTYTPEEVEAWFRLDLARALDTARASIPRFDELPPQVRLVVVGLAFQCGPTGFRAWRGFILAANYRAYNGMAAELVDSKWWDEVGEQRRRQYVTILRSQR